MPYIETREARADDRGAVLAFCLHTWEWGDYIEYVWDEWLHDPHGKLFVATADDQPVAVAHLRMLTESDGWLEGMRVDPAYRHHGLAKALHIAMQAEAMQRGATNVRLVTESTNVAAITLCEHGGFRLIGAFAQFRAAPVTTLTKRQYALETVQPATAADIPAIIDYLNASSIFPATGGVYYYGFTAYPITDRLLESKVATGQISILRRWERLDGVMIAEPREGRQGRQLSLGYIDGTTESISLMAYALRVQATTRGLESVNAYVPDLMMVRDAFVGAEYEWDGKVFYAYEKGLV